MKPRSIQKLFAFIIITMMFSIATNSVNAQKPKGNGHGGGHGGTNCNCSVRPIPFQCGQICGYLINKPTVNNVFSINGTNSTLISFELSETQNVSIKIYDGMGRLIKTLANNRMPQGEHEVDWNAKDENGSPVVSGTYVLQFVVGNNIGTKKLSIP